MMNLLDRYRGCLLGMACGDAVGTTLEFVPKDSVEPIDDMVGGGPFDLAPGEWTDDTSMALCLATSLVECGEFNARDQMERYCAWWKEGYLSSTGECFDIGMTTSGSLTNFRLHDEPFSGPTHENASGNGCIMRLAPVPLFFHPDVDAVIQYSGESSRTTHGSEQCVDSSQYFGWLLHLALSGVSKEELLFEHSFPEFLHASVEKVACGSYREKSEAEIFGTGYVVECLEAALWSFWNSESFEEAILKAVNLGDDADTTGAVCGQIAGAYYGVNNIPKHWLETLAMRKEIETLADRLYAHNHAE